MDRVFKTERRDLSVKDQIPAGLGFADRFREDLWEARTWRQEPHRWRAKQSHEGFEGGLY